MSSTTTNVQEPEAAENEAQDVAAASAAEALMSGKERGNDAPVAVDVTAVTKPDPQLSKEEMIEEALNCPCIAAMKEGSCGESFIAAYRCFLESETEPKGMDCMPQFTNMQACMAEHPDEYNLDDDDDPFAKEPARDTDQAADSQSVDASTQEKEKSPEVDIEIGRKPSTNSGRQERSPPRVSVA